MRWTLLLAAVPAFMSVAFSAHAQPSGAAAPLETAGAVPAVEVPLIAWVASRAHALPGTLTDFDSPASRREAFRRLLHALLDRNWEQALIQAGALKYLLVSVREGDAAFVVASDDGEAGRDPIIVLNLSPQRDFVVHAPHVPFEQGTAEQAVALLRDLRGRAAIVSGAHRCASLNGTVCDGSTAVCGDRPERYRASDAAHNTASLFHAAHVAMAERWRSARRSQSRAPS